jgi:hypothetical protein
MPKQEMDVELGQESEALCRSPRLKVTDGVPRGAVNPGRFYLLILIKMPSHENLMWLTKAMSKGAKMDVWTSDIMLI